MVYPKINFHQCLQTFCLNRYVYCYLFLSLVVYKPAALLGERIQPSFIQEEKHK